MVLNKYLQVERKSFHLETVERNRRMALTVSMCATTPTEGGENMAVLLIVCSHSNTHILSRDRCPPSPPQLYWLCHFLSRWAS